MKDLLVAYDARISDCGHYRYMLQRQWHPDADLGIIMLNPSTADANRDDPTIRRCMNFAREAGFGGILVGNLFAWRATDPRELAQVSDPVGPENDIYLQELTDRAALVLVAWGSHPVADERALHVLRIVSREGSLRVVSLGTTKEGAPRHPLYVPSDTPFSIYKWKDGAL